MWPAPVLVHTVLVALTMLMPATICAAMQADAERCLHAAQVNALKDAGIYEKTALILTSKHGNSPSSTAR